MEKDQIIINGGVEISIIKLDGTAESVKIRLLKINQFSSYLQAVESEEKTAELLCDKEPGWAETISTESLLDIIEKGHEINFPSVFRWAERKANLNAKLLPIAQKGLQTARALPPSALTPQ